MKKITFEFSEEQFARLQRAAKVRHESPRELLRARLIELLADPIDPFAPPVRSRREQDEEFLRRIA